MARTAARTAGRWPTAARPPTALALALVGSATAGHPRRPNGPESDSRAAARGPNRARQSGPINTGGRPVASCEMCGRGATVANTAQADQADQPATGEAPAGTGSTSEELLIKEGDVAAAIHERLLSLDDDDGALDTVVEAGRAVVKVN